MAGVFRFKSDCSRLYSWLARRRHGMEEARRYIEPLWADIRKNFEPSLGKGLLDDENADARDASRDDRSIITSEPRNLVWRMAAGLQSGVTNQSRQWFRLGVEEGGDDSASREWLDLATERVGELMARSNVYNALDQLYMHLGQFGTAAALIFPDEEYGAYMQTLDEGCYWLGEDRRRRVNVLLRRQEMTVAGLIEEFGRGFLPDNVLPRAGSDEAAELEKRRRVWHMVCPVSILPCELPDIAPEMTFASIYWVDGASREGNCGIVAIRGFNYNPIIAPRWLAMESVYGVGPGKIGLSDAKELQQLELDKLKLAKLGVDPAMLAPSSMKGHAVNTAPGGITYYNEASSGGGGRLPVGRLFDTGQSFDGLLLVIRGIEERLRKIFYSDLFAMLTNMELTRKPMTATEIQELSSEKVALLGPVLTRLNSDLLDPLVDACFAIATAADAKKLEGEDEDAAAAAAFLGGGVLGAEAFNLSRAPESLRGRSVRFEYRSSLHVEQASAARLSGIMRVVDATGAIARLDPSAVRMFDGLKAVEAVAVSGYEMGIVRDYDEVKAELEAEARAAAEAQAAQQPEEEGGNNEYGRS